MKYCIKSAIIGSVYKANHLQDMGFNAATASMHVLSWWYLAVLDYALLNISPKCYFVSYSYLAKVDI